MDRLQKKYKTSTTPQANINKPTDITDLALTKYEELKKNYNFVSFEDADKNNKKKVVSA